MSKAIPGKLYLSAITYALQACPKSDLTSRLQHVAFIDDKIIASDGRRWHVGLFPTNSGPSKAVCVTRNSLAKVIHGLNYAKAMAESSGDFTVKHQGPKVLIGFGGEHPLEHHLDVVDVGELPKRWDPPVPDNAPPLAPGKAAEFECGQVADAVKWYRSWERDHGQVKVYGLDADGPLRYDISVNKEIVVQAYLLPVHWPLAHLVADEPLLAKADGKRRSQSILDLRVTKEAPKKSEDVKPAKEPKAKKAAKGKVNGVAVPESAV